MLERLTLAKWIYDKGRESLPFELPTFKKSGGHYDWADFPDRNRLGLVYYLLLTCFDILGQAHEWIPFGSWLASKKSEHVTERGQLAVPPEASPAEAAELLHKHYQSLYGVKSSFYRFINDLPEAKRKMLFHSFSLWKDGSARKDTNEKKKFLYAIRNSFTHRGIAAGHSGRQMFNKETGRPIVHDVSIERDSEHSAWIMRQSTVPIVPPSSDWSEVSVSLWPYVLFDIVSESIGKTVFPDMPLEVVVKDQRRWTSVQMRYEFYRPQDPAFPKMLAERILNL